MLIKKDNARKLLDMSRAQIERMPLADTTFPKPIKLGDSQQSSVFYVKSEIEDWIEKLKSQRT